MKIFITGADGFLGRAFLTELRDRADAAPAIDTIVALVEKDRGIIRKILGNDARVVIGDICRIGAHAAELKDTDVVIHLAALVHNAKASREQHMKVNYAATKDLFDLFVRESRSEAKQFIYISTVSVFGNYKDAVYAEDDPCDPDTPYGESKLMAEQYIRERCATGVARYTIMRPATMFGAGDKGNFKKMADTMRRFRVFPIFNKGAKKSFVYVKDVARAICACIGNPRVCNATLVISAPSVTMDEMFESIRRVLGIEARPLYFAWPYLRYVPIVDKLSRSNMYSHALADRSLGFTPVSFEAGLRRMVSEEAR